VAVDAADPDPAVIAGAARRLLEGGIVAAPSDTVYGYLALPRSAEARERLRRLKGRPGPFLVLVTAWEAARSWTRGVPEATWKALEAVWPGPVTVILPTDPAMPGSLNGGIGLRMPDSPFLNAILAAVGEPLFSTSANRPGESAPGTAQEAAAACGDGAVLVLDGGPVSSRAPSTVVDLTCRPPRIVRAGRGDASPLLDPGTAPS
jgi:L-threonylcarbamoyladenylate synthase